jgi:zinc transport system substrate-binding protein
MHVMLYCYNIRGARRVEKQAAPIKAATASVEPIVRGLVLLLTLFVCSLAAAQPLRVVVSVPPIKTFAEKIGGEHVDVGVMVRPGHDPHTYDPTPQQIGALAKAALYIRTGVPFEDVWMERIRSANPRIQVLDTRTGLSPHTGDPHVWTSPARVRDMAGMIRDRLTALDPAHARDFAHNHAAFSAELDLLDGEIRSLLQALTRRSFLVIHPAWGYFAETYGLTQVSVEREGKEPGARALATIIDQAKQERIRVVFVQPQQDERLADQIAHAIGGVVVTVDPLAADYVGNLRRVARQFAEALRQ